jgi:hypothetical protein
MGDGAIGSAARGRASGPLSFFSLLPRGGHRFLSREAYQLGYACQRETRSDRLMRKARRVHRALGGKGDPLEEDAPEKPKGMHWRTYERKLAAWTGAVEAADEAFAKTQPS